MCGSPYNQIINSGGILKSHLLTKCCQLYKDNYCRGRKFIKMVIELPVCTRCCLCLPLRYGLIAWGYARLVLASMILFGVTKSFCSMLQRLQTEPVISNKVYAVILGLLVVLTLADIVLNIIFIIGGHKKNLKLLKTYYMYSFVLWILLAVTGVALTIYVIILFALKELDLFNIYVLLVDVATFLTQILIHAYVLLLVRSEIVKLTNTSEFRFVNNAAESQCTMKSDDETANGENGTEHTSGNGKLDIRVKENVATR